MSQQDHTHWWRDGDASAAPSSLQIGHHQAVVSPVRDECCAGAAGRSPRRTDPKEQQHEPAAWMSRRLVSTAVLTSGMTASARVSEGINRAGYPVREPTRATLVSATWPGGVFLLRPTLRARVGRVSGPLRFRHETFCGAYMMKPPKNRLQRGRWSGERPYTVSRYALLLSDDNLYR